MPTISTPLQPDDIYNRDVLLTDGSGRRIGVIERYQDLRWEFVASDPTVLPFPSRPDYLSAKSDAQAYADHLRGGEL